MTNTNLKKKILIVDDSALMRQLLTFIIEEAPDLEVVGAAPDPLVARKMIKELNPDVVTLDIEMPKMDGIAFLSKIMSLRPMPVVMISSLTQKSADVTLKAMGFNPPREKIFSPSFIFIIIACVKKFYRNCLGFLGALSLFHHRLFCMGVGILPPKLYRSIYRNSEHALFG